MLKVRCFPYLAFIMDKPELQMFIKDISLPQRQVFFDKLIDTQLAKTITFFLGTQSFITVPFPELRYWDLL